MTDISPTEIIDNFISRYRKEYDFFDQAAHLAAQIIEDRLNEAGIRSIVTSRAKSVRSLEPKIRERALRKNYTRVKDIFDDIVDLAGVRIAMYFPAEQTQVDRIIKNLFVLDEDSKVFKGTTSTELRYIKKFSGYWATHYRGYLKESILSDAQKRYREARIEIQVASVLMHAWSEVEHDLVYKPHQGELSEEEYAILDEINGMVLAGEIALELLQKAGKTRVASGGRAFRNHYDLASHLLNVFEPTAELSIKETALGRIDLLYEFLKQLNLGSPDQLKPYVQSLSSDLEKRPLADQIIDQLLAEDEGRYHLYERIRYSGLVSTNYSGKTRRELTPETKKEINIFLERWSAFEQEINEIAKKTNMPRIFMSSTLLSRLGIADQTLLKDFERTRQMRNELVHGLSLPSLEDIREAISNIQKIEKQIQKR